MAAHERLVVRLSFSSQRFPLNVPFRISREVQTTADVLTVVLSQDGCHGRGETVGVNYRGETLAGLAGQIESVMPQVEAGATRGDLLALLPPGGARNALDCALWDLEAKLCGVPAWQLAERPEPRPVPMTATLSLDTPERMALAASRVTHASALKLKLGAGDDDVARVAAVRRAAPAAVLLCDVNEGWSFEQLRRFMPDLVALDLRLIEQPLKAGDDEELAGYRSPITLCADESCFDRADLAVVRRRYSAINIKLEKCGGLTEAIALAGAATQLDLPIMVGCMVSSSLSIAPALLLHPLAQWYDLDGPTYLTADRVPGIVYRDGVALPALPALWG